MKETLETGLGAVAFNIGGQVFTTSRETLFREPSSRLALISKNAVPCYKDQLGTYFIDRDGKHFAVSRLDKQ
jgi:hypothetical protein